MTIVNPHVHILYRRNTMVESGKSDRLGVVYEQMDGYHALFAIRISPLSYEVLAARKLGFLERDLLDEALDRQRRFIASLHCLNLSSGPDPHLRTTALRYISSPPSEKVDAILVGKAFAPELEESRALAMAWCEEIVTLFPRDYELFPLESEEAFMLQSGQRLLEEISSPVQTLEVRRREMLLPKPFGRDVIATHYLVYPFAWHRNGMEQVSQVMASTPSPTVVSVTLRPTCLYEVEEMYLARFHEASVKQSASEHPVERSLGELAANIYADCLQSWQQPFLVRMQLAAPERVPNALARAAGCAISYGAPTGNWKEIPFPGYDLITPGQNECVIARDNVSLLEMDDWGMDQTTAPYGRFRYLTDEWGAHCGFRFLVRLKEGIPGA